MAKNALEKTFRAFASFGKLLTSIAKIIVLSKKNSPVPVYAGKDIVIMGNGPSLSGTIRDGKDFFKGKLLFSVNFAAKSPYFTELKPDFHILADPAFFTEPKHFGIFETMAENIQWPLRLFLPASAKKINGWMECKRKLESNPNISIGYFNMTKIAGPAWFMDKATMKGWGGPAPRNVMIPAIALSLRMKCPNIYLAGADHSWIKDISINEKNEVLLNDKHFYDQDTQGKEVNYKTVKLSQVLGSISIALHSYEILDQIARKHNRHIFNISPGSFIDAFDRMKLPTENSI